VEEAAYYSPEDADRLRAAAAASIETGVAFEAEVSIRLAAGGLRHVVSSGTPYTDSRGRVARILGTVQDVTRRKQSEAALRALARHLDYVREEEHTRIARQVHDELGQALTALRLDLTWVGRKIPKGNTALRRRIDAAVALTDETITVGQRIVAELRPPILDDLGLVPAVEWYAQHFAKRSGLRIELDAGAEEPVVPDRLAVTAYRIVQEALTNVARHAQATHARVRLGAQDGALTIEIRDDGMGCPEEVIRSPRSFGLVGMRERAASHGGEIVITSSPGAGTTVRVTFPLERRREPRVPR
jgi:signal transduction histidine kinase